jgi:hypothetical protein
MEIREMGTPPTEIGYGDIGETEKSKTQRKPRIRCLEQRNWNTGK